MFNFQKEVIINSAEQISRIQQLVQAGQEPSKIPAKIRVHDADYFPKYIVDNAIYQTDPIEGSNFKLKINVNKLGFGSGMVSQVRGRAAVSLLIELGLDNDYRADYGSALWYFRKPILVNVADLNSADAQTAAEKFAKAINASVPKENCFVKAHVEKNDQGASEDVVDDIYYVVIDGTDSHQKVRRVVIDGLPKVISNMTDINMYQTILDVSPVESTDETALYSYTPNNVEFGTYDYILHNLRLPTYSNLRFTSPSATEMPVKGVKYTQFSFAYCVPRVGFGGLSVVGQTNHSTTLHTFYVAESAVEAFKTTFTAMGITFNTLGRKDMSEVKILPDTYASTVDLAQDEKIEENKAAIKAAHPDAFGEEDLESEKR